MSYNVKSRLRRIFQNYRAGAGVMIHTHIPYINTDLSDTTTAEEHTHPSDLCAQKYTALNRLFGNTIDRLVSLVNIWDIFWHEMKTPPPLNKSRCTYVYVHTMWHNIFLWSIDFEVPLRFSLSVEPLMKILLSGGLGYCLPPSGCGVVPLLWKIFDNPSRSHV